MWAQTCCPQPCKVFASQVGHVAEKQEPGLIFKMQINPLPSGLAGFSAVWSRIIDSQSRRC